MALTKSNIWGHGNCMTWSCSLLLISLPISVTFSSLWDSGQFSLIPLSFLREWWPILILMCQPFLAFHFGARSFILTWTTKLLTSTMFFYGANSIFPEKNAKRSGTVSNVEHTIFLTYFFSKYFYNTSSTIVVQKLQPFVYMLLSNQAHSSGSFVLAKLHKGKHSLLD